MTTLKGELKMFSYILLPEFFGIGVTDDYENSISSVVASLSGGAGIDIRKLAEDLTNVERTC